MPVAKLCLKRSFRIGIDDLVLPQSIPGGIVCDRPLSGNAVDLDIAAFQVKRSLRVTQFPSLIPLEVAERAHVWLSLLRLLPLP